MVDFFARKPVIVARARVFTRVEHGVEIFAGLPGVVESDRIDGNQARSRRVNTRGLHGHRQVGIFRNGLAAGAFFRVQPAGSGSAVGFSAGGRAVLGTRASVFAVVVLGMRGHYYSSLVHRLVPG